MQSIIYLSVLLIYITTAPFSCTTACDESDDDLSDSQSFEVTSTPGYSIESIYVECNDSFITKMAFLEALNRTGSFPEESDLTPLCFLRCFLHKSGIYDEVENVIGERAVEIGWVDSMETMHECMEQMVGSPCQKAYYLVRCLTVHKLNITSD